MSTAWKYHFLISSEVNFGKPKFVYPCSYNY